MSVVAKSLPWILTGVGIFFVFNWLTGSGNIEKPIERLPGADRIGTMVTTQKAADLRGKFITSDGVPADLPGAWPRFRGIHWDNISTEKVPLSMDWAKQGPKPVWSTAMGEGYAGPAVLAGRVYVLDYDQETHSDALRCLSLANGREIWRRSYDVDIKRNHGMSRTVPAVTGKYVVTIGPKCHVLCVDAVNGDFRWGIDLVAEYGAKVPPWYAGQCPLIDGDRVILAPGGEALMIAVDLASGKVIWKSLNPQQWLMTHSSIIPMTFAGKQMYIYCGSGGVAGISADSGSILWQSTQWKVSMATVPTPILIGEDRIFLAGGYGAGSMMMQLKGINGTIDPQVLYRLRPEVFGSEQQTPIFYQEHIYGVIPNGQLVCLGIDGKPVWNSGSHRFGIGPYIVADDKIFLLNDTGLLRVVQASADGYHELGHAQILDNAHESWGPMAIVGGYLIARDLRRMVCIDLKETQHDRE